MSPVCERQAGEGGVNQLFRPATVEASVSPSFVTPRNSVLAERTQNEVNDASKRGNNVAFSPAVRGAVF